MRFSSFASRRARAVLSSCSRPLRSRRAVRRAARWTRGHQERAAPRVARMASAATRALRAVRERHGLLGGRAGPRVRPGPRVLRRVRARSRLPERDVPLDGCALLADGVHRGRDNRGGPTDAPKTTASLASARRTATACGGHPSAAGSSSRTKAPPYDCASGGCFAPRASPARRCPCRRTREASLCAGRARRRGRWRPRAARRGARRRRARRACRSSCARRQALGTRSSARRATSRSRELPPQANERVEIEALDA